MQKQLSIIFEVFIIGQRNYSLFQVQYTTSKEFFCFNFFTTVPYEHIKDIKELSHLVNIYIKSFKKYTSVVINDKYTK